MIGPTLCLLVTQTWLYEVLCNIKGRQKTLLGHCI